MGYQNSVVVMTSKPTKDWYVGLIMGLLLGIFGNLFSSYLVKYYEALGFAPWIWGASAGICLVAVLLFTWYLWKQAQKADLPS
jgi:uncharacterized BrkB/YihY/UPF0761 family membrane protein